MDSPIFEFGRVHCCKYGFSQKDKKKTKKKKTKQKKKKKNRLANSVDPDEIARNEPFQDLHCLQIRLFWPTGVK